MGKLFSANEREQHLRTMTDKQLDLLVIGGGITGAGIAWDASIRGMKVGLLEMNDFASGASGRATKLTHSELRHWKQGEIRRARRVSSERSLLYHNAPHLVEEIPMLLPIYKKGTYRYVTTSLGLSLCGWLAGRKRGKKSKMLRGSKKTLAFEPLLKSTGLKGSGYYYEYRTDDARLAVELMKSAYSRSALFCNYVEIIDFIYKDGKAIGVIAEDKLMRKSYELFARKIVNAAGPWADQLRALDQSPKGRKLLLTRGVHLVVDHACLPIKQAAYIDSADGGMLFVIPYGKKTYIGTTDTIYEGDPGNLRITDEDARDVMNAIHVAFPSIQLRLADIESGWACLQPLLCEEKKSSSRISRKDELLIADSGLITIVSGKLTGYRNIAEKVVDLVAKQLQDENGTIYPPCTTNRVTLSGGTHAEAVSYEKMEWMVVEEGRKIGIAAETAQSLLARYGSNALEIYLNYKELNSRNLKLEEQLLYAEIIYCIHHEMTVSAVDFLVKTGCLLFDRQRAKRLGGKVIMFFGEQLGWDDFRIVKEWSLLKERLRLTSFTPDELSRSEFEELQLRASQ